MIDSWLIRKAGEDGGAKSGGLVCGWRSLRAICGSLEPQGRPNCSWDWLSLPAGLRWVDVGCGTGALTQTTLEQSNPSQVNGIEPSEGFLSLARDNTHDHRANFKSSDAMSLPLGDAEADVVVAGLVLNFVSDQHLALQEMCRIIQPGGTVALYVWDYSGEMQLMRYFWNGVTELFSDGADLDEGKQFPI